MNDARQTFHDLQHLAGSGFSHTEIAHDLDRVERRAGRRRSARVATLSLGVVAVAVVAAMGVNNWREPEPLPAFAADSTVASPSPTPGEEIVNSRATTEEVSDPAGCASAEGVPGKRLGNLGGLEGWFNSTPDAPCDEWEQRVLDHPDTVLIHTPDATMVEAYYRTSLDALAEYLDLGPEFVVPNPDPAWPADSLVLIDARSGEILEEFDLAGFADAIAGNHG